MSIRNFKQSDRETVLAMVDSFYHSPAVHHPIPVENFGNAFSEMCDGGSERIRGLVVEHEGKIAGFCSLSFSYSTEAGGPAVLLEEIFIAPAFRGQGLGESLFNFVKNDYRGKAARLRLEVAKENLRAIALYKHLGFMVLPYTQMINEDF